MEKSVAEDSGNSESLRFERRSVLRGAEHETGVAHGNGSYNSIIIPLGHFALVVVALFIVSNAADKAGESRATATNAVAMAQDARMEARVLQSKVESDRREIAELKGFIEGKGKP